MCVLSYDIRLMRTQLLSLGSQWVTKVGFTVMIQKQSNNRHSGRAHNHQEQKRSGRSGVQQRVCSLFFSTWRELFTMNSFLLTLLSTLTFTVMFQDASEKTCNEDPNFGATTTNSIITCLPTRTWKPHSLWLTITRLSFPILPTCQT
jgi:hypothetical protein